MRVQREILLAIFQSVQLEHRGTVSITWKSTPTTTVAADSEIIYWHLSMSTDETTLIAFVIWTSFNSLKCCQALESTCDCLGGSRDDFRDVRITTNSFCKLLTTVSEVKLHYNNCHVRIVYSNSVPIAVVKEETFLKILDIFEQETLMAIF